MSLAQRGTSTSSISSAGYYTVDRFKTNMTSAGAWTQSQSTDVPTGQGFAKSLKMDCTTANASLSAGSFLILHQFIEGQNLQYLKKGTSNAESLTLSFWVKSNKTGTYIAELFDEDNNRMIQKSYTISSANTWEKKTLTFAGDTTGAFGNDNGRSLALNFWLAAGSNFTGGLTTSWGSSGGSRAQGQVNLADSTSNEWYVTGVQLEAGTAASDFEFLPVDVNLQRCQRYLFAITSPNGQGNFGAGGFFSGTGADTAVHFPIQMRANYSMSYSALTDFRCTSHTASASPSALALNTSNALTSARVRVTIGSSIGTAGNYALIYTNNSNAVLKFDAEL